MNDSHLTPQERAYFETLGKLDPSPEMAAHIRQAIQQLRTDKKPVPPQHTRATLGGFLIALGLRKRR